MSWKTESIISAGIDIGTSTTKLVLSRLTLQNTAGRTHVPRIEITDKEILYKSPIFRTPLLDETTIDVAQIERFVFDQYENAQIQPEFVQSGAILITGETATKKNASELIHHLSDTAGEFLVATAGPDLESIWAARGSGAADFSKKTSKLVANIDIGGGTTNIAVLKHGEVIGTVALHVGGRLLEFEKNRLAFVAPSMHSFAQSNHIDIKQGDLKNESIVQFVIQSMVESIFYVLHGQENEVEVPLLLGHEPNWYGMVDSIMFSGGVAQCMYPDEGETLQQKTFDDIGLQLAGALKESPLFQQFEWVAPDETVRATVTGAGTQSTEISGATIQIASTLLPIKNLPVITCDLNDSMANSESLIAAAIMQGHELFDANREGDYFALFLKDPPYLHFTDVEHLAKSIAEKWLEIYAENTPLILILEADYAKVLGQCLLVKGTNQQIICLDQIQVRTGDYIDIGKQLDSGVVPVVVKTLAFHTA